MESKGAGRAWVAAMPDSVARQRRLLDLVLSRVEAEPGVRWFELGCSLARGAGDAWSDIDAGAGIADEHWAEVDRYGEELTGVAPFVDRLRQRFPDRDGRPIWHLFTVYQDGTQLSLVLMPASLRRGLAPGSVVLHDADGRLATPYRPENLVAPPDVVREWAGLGWMALAALLDESAASLPDGLDRTVAALDPAALRASALAVADLLDAATAAARAEVDFIPPDGLRRWALDLLRGTVAHAL